MTSKPPRYYLVRADMLPEVFGKVVQAKRLLESGEARTVFEAVSRVGIGRSAFYKYRDAVSPFFDMKSGNIMSLHLMLRDEAGVLSSVLSIFADSGANILTINQGIPINGAASLTITAQTDCSAGRAEELLSRLESGRGVIKAEILAG